LDGLRAGRFRLSFKRLGADFQQHRDRHPARNMQRFYRLDTQPDLFGGDFLMKQYGRISVHGRIMAERFDSAAGAAVRCSARPKRRW